ncbi:winged helix-turn-helix domain-containing protein [Natronorubrum halophilum]|uniref:winged helix-turn-helix domain-containing protein n=1 Tax=Natronorubrum halophilum TaxID=1702106 RepID=UPI001EE8A2B3|nr:winged helix-turn-helix domain-containing protein [Natronorubrum halophilum]
MAAENHGPMGLDRKEIDNKILDELHDGRNVPSNLADELDVSRQYISQRLKLLEAADHVENIGRGVYDLIDDPREFEREPPEQRAHNTYEQDHWETAHVERIDNIGAFESPSGDTELDEVIRVDLDGYGHGGASMHDVDENIQVSFWLTPETGRTLLEDLKTELERSNPDE